MTVPRISIAGEGMDLPRARVAVIRAVFGKINEYLDTVSKYDRNTSAYLPCHVKVKMVMFVTTQVHHLPMSTDTDEEEPHTKSPDPKPKHDGQ